MKIAFDTEAYKTNAIAGPFAYEHDLLNACVSANPDDAAYRAWAIKHAVAPESGSIVTTAYNPDLLDRRFLALSAQLDDFIGAKQGEAPKSGLVYQAPAIVSRNVMDAALENPTTAVKLLMVSTTRENLHFELRDMLGSHKLHTVVAAPSQEYADRCNELIQQKAPELSSELVFKSDWQKEMFDVAHINTALHYFDELEVEGLIDDIKYCGADRVVFSDILKNDDPDGAAQWKAQRYSGGVIPLFIPAKGALSVLMQNAGYAVEEELQAPVAYDVTKGSSFAAQNPKLDNFSYKYVP